MADANDTNIWANADVYIAPAGTAGPTDLTAAWGAAWDAVGLLDGAAGFQHARSEDTKEHFAWGGILFAQTKSKHRRTVKFTALEDNDTIFALVNPGSTRNTATGVRTDTVKIPVAGTKFAIGMETTTGAKKRRRFALNAEIQSVADLKENEDAPSVWEITVLIFPEADTTIWHELSTDPSTL